jgi:hypothetical protein
MKNLDAGFLGVLRVSIQRFVVRIGRRFDRPEHLHTLFA